MYLNKFWTFVIYLSSCLWSNPIFNMHLTGQIISVTVEITANHLGYFQFKLCPNNNPKKDPTQACFDKWDICKIYCKATTRMFKINLYLLVNHSYTYFWKHCISKGFWTLFCTFLTFFRNILTIVPDNKNKLYIGSKTGKINLKLQLPKGLKCTQCILQVIIISHIGLQCFGFRFFYRLNYNFFYLWSLLKFGPFKWFLFY